MTEHFTRQQESIDRINTTAHRIIACRIYDLRHQLAAEDLTADEEDRINREIANLEAHQARTGSGMTGWPTS